MQQFEADFAGAGGITGYTYSSVNVETNGYTKVSGTVEIDTRPRASTLQLDEIDGRWLVCTYDPVPQPPDPADSSAPST